MLMPSYLKSLHRAQLYSYNKSLLIKLLLMNMQVISNISKLSAIIGVYISYLLI